jgi:hypothetical protein
MQSESVGNSEEQDCHTYTHNDTVAEPLEMVRPVFCIYQHIMQQLHRLGLLQLDVLTIAETFGQVLMNELSKQAPGGRVVHPKHVVALGDELLGYHVRWTIA